MGHGDTVSVPELYAITYDAMYNWRNALRQHLTSSPFAKGATSVTVRRYGETAVLTHPASGFTCKTEVRLFTTPPD